MEAKLNKSPPLHCRLEKLRVCGSVLLGKSNVVILEESIVSDIIANFHHNFTSHRGQVFQRCIVNGCLFYSKLYTRTKKRNSFTVAYCLNNVVQFCQIDYFLCISVCDSQYVYAYVTKYAQQCTNQSHFHVSNNALDYGVQRIVPVCVSNNILIDVNCLLCKCVFVTVSAQDYVCVPPNTLSID